MATKVATAATEAATDFKSFHYLDNGDIQFSICSTNKSTRILDGGFYKLSVNPNTNPQTTNLSLMESEKVIAIHDFPDKEKLDDLFDAFFDERVKSTLNELGFKHKVGVLLYGKEGTGKSTIMKHYAIRGYQEQNAIVFYLTNNYVFQCWEFIEKIRKIQSNPIFVILDEIDQSLYNGYEASLKTMLDGNSSIDNCFFLAATNYFDKIPDALKNRPSRFKHVLDIEGIQNPEDVKKVLIPMIQNLFSDEEISEFANNLKGQTLDFIKQFAMDKIMDLETYSHTRRKPIGFVTT